jgi:uncharacterized protein YndB with AHSA1/START domain
MSDQVSVTREIDAPPEKVWAMVADITRMGEWSPENEGGAWLGGATAAAPGAKFRASNRRGKRKWKTLSTVTAAEAGRTFSFRVSSAGIQVADWSYEFEPTASGCRVTESWVEQRPGWFKPLARVATGVADRSVTNRAGMEQTLERLAAVAEASA